LKAPSGIVPAVKGQLPAPVTLPSDLSGSLKYLDDRQLHRLQDAVAVEVNRRNNPDSLKAAASPPKTGTSSQPSILPHKIQDPEDIPLAKANLVRASFKAGLKPAAIARNFRIPQSLVNRILNQTQKPNN
jgi:hypothetical protein